MHIGLHFKWQFKNHDTANTENMTCLQAIPVTQHNNGMPQGLPCGFFFFF